MKSMDEKIGIQPLYFYFCLPHSLLFSKNERFALIFDLFPTILSNRDFYI